MKQVNLRKLLRYYINHWYIIALAAIVGLSAASAYVYLQEPMYKSSSLIMIIGTGRVVTGPNQNSVTINNSLSLLTSHKVLNPVVQKVDYAGGYEHLKKNIAAKNIAGTDMISISVNANNPELGQLLLDTIVDEFKSQIATMPHKTQLGVNVIDQASRPNAPYNIRPGKQIALIAAAAISLTMIVVFLLYTHETATARRNPKKPKK